MRNRLPITRVGRVEIENGQVMCNGWGFGVLGVPEGVTFDVDPSGGLLEGWTAVELHAIAHGVPCDCPIGQAHARDGLLD